MSDMLIAPELEIFPQRKRWTREECYRLLDSGKLIGRYELIDGEIISKMGQKPPHSDALELFYEWLISIWGRGFVRVQLPITIAGKFGKRNEPEPDIAVRRERAESLGVRHPSPEELILIVEIADTSLHYDLGIKAKLYSRIGIIEYWVVDVIGRKLHCHRSPTANGYSVIIVFDESEMVCFESHPDISIQVSELLTPNVG